MSFYEKDPSTCLFAVEYTARLSNWKKKKEFELLHTRRRFLIEKKTGLPSTPGYKERRCRRKKKRQEREKCVGRSRWKETAWGGAMYIALSLPSTLRLSSRPTPNLYNSEKVSTLEKLLGGRGGKREEDEMVGGERTGPMEARRRKLGILSLSLFFSVMKRERDVKKKIKRRKCIGYFTACKLATKVQSGKSKEGRHEMESSRNHLQKEWNLYRQSRRSVRPPSIIIPMSGRNQK